MTDKPALNTKLHVLVAAVTAAERGEPMPRTDELAGRIGCAPHGVAMAVSHLERQGILKRLHAPGRPFARRRLMVVATGAATAEVDA